MYCKKCGAELAPQNNFCRICGERTSVGITSQKSKKRNIVIVSLLCIALLILSTTFVFGDHAKQSRYAKMAKSLETSNPAMAMEYAKKSVALGGSDDLLLKIQADEYAKQAKKLLISGNYKEAVKLAEKAMAAEKSKESKILVSVCYNNLYDQEPTFSNITYMEHAYSVDNREPNKIKLQEAYIKYANSLLAVANPDNNTEIGSLIDKASNIDPSNINLIALIDSFDHVKATESPAQSSGTYDGYKDVLHFDTRLITVSDLEKFPKKEYEFIRNEIYARHGRVFSNPKFSNYFKQFSWYTPGNPDQQITLNPIEKANVKFILNLE